MFLFKAYYGGDDKKAKKYINDDNAIVMKAMLMECPRSSADEGDKSKGHDMCRNKILVKIKMENGKKVVFTSLLH